jgi:hypothetical protein
MTLKWTAERFRMGKVRILGRNDPLPNKENSMNMKPSMKKYSGQFLRFTLCLAALMLSLSAFGSEVWTNTGSLNTARRFQTASLLSSGLVLAAGGYDLNYLSSAELYNWTNGTWAYTGSMATGRTQHKAVLLTNGQVLVAGGQSSSPLTLASAELYNPETGLWSTTASMAAPREYSTLTLLTNGLVLAAAGLNDNVPVELSSAELYDPDAGTWTNTGSLNIARQNHTATLLPNGLVLVAGGGNTGGVLTDSELYNPETGTWTNTGSLNVARDNHTATLLPNGLVLVAGGIGTSSNATNSAELYNPESGTWTTTGSMITARYSHAATLLPNGQVLVAAGENGSGAISQAEIYDPSTGTWMAISSLNNARFGQSATLLPDGTVMEAGGNSGAGSLSSAELYEVSQPCTPYPATATATVTNGFVVAATVTDGGCGYTNAPEVLIQGGGGTGATATAVVSNGMVAGLTITDAGNGYTSTPTIYIFFPTSIITQPQSLLVNAYSNASFSVTAVGTEPLSYQWFFDGTNLPGATSSILTISNVEQTNLGTYGVLVTNVFASLTSSNATLSMYPFIITPFTGDVADRGTNVILSVGAWGTGPLSYQWFDNGVAVSGATNSALDFSSIQFTNAGQYSVVVSNALGSVTNPPEAVVVNPAGVSLGLYPGVTISGTVGYTYTIQSTTNLSDTNSWITQTNLMLTQPIQLWVDTNTDSALPANPLRFYRVLPGQ